MADELSSSGEIPALSALLQFSAQRQRLIANNIANINTPDYRPVDVSVADFQQSLKDAIDRRRNQTGGASGDLRFNDTQEVRQDGLGRLVLTPQTPGSNILFHDRNNRDLERLQQAQVENATVYRIAADMLRGRFDLLRSAIAERV